MQSLERITVLSSHRRILAQFFQQFILFEHILYYTSHSLPIDPWERRILGLLEPRHALVRLNSMNPMSVGGATVPSRGELDLLEFFLFCFLTCIHI